MNPVIINTYSISTCLKRETYPAFATRLWENKLLKKKQKRRRRQGEGKINITNDFHQIKVVRFYKIYRYIRVI